MSEQPDYLFDEIVFGGSTDPGVEPWTMLLPTQVPRVIKDPECIGRMLAGEITKVHPDSPMWYRAIKKADLEAELAAREKPMVDVEIVQDDELKAAVAVVIDRLKSDPDYRRGWRDNIAMSIHDTRATGMSVHDWRNACAERFLDTLCR